MQQQSRPFQLPLSTKEIHRGVKDKLRFTKGHLVSQISATLLQKGIAFLEGYYFYMSKDLMPPFDEKELKEHLLETILQYIIVELEK